MIRLIDDSIISVDDYRDEIDRRNTIHQERYEIDRRNTIHQERYEAFCRNAPIMPRHDNSDSYELVLTRKADDGTSVYAVEFHRNRANMRLDDWNRVRVTFIGGSEVSRVSGVSVMHAILIAQSCGMPPVARIDWRTDKAITRRELGNLKTYENQNRKGK